MADIVRNPGRLMGAADFDYASLIYGWGNEGWSAWSEYLAGTLRAVQQTGGPILECGSGLSTLLLGVIAGQLRTRVWSLEHDAGWARRVSLELRRFDITSATVCMSPIQDYGEFHWYRPPMELLPANFSLVVCDGPPASIRGGRYGMLPIMRANLRPGCVIILDDAEREQEQSIARRWAAELDATIRLHGKQKPYIELKVPGAAEP
jgi:hypothetical protein